MFPIDHTINILFSNNVDNPVTTGAFYAASWLFDPVPFTILLILSVFVVYKRLGKKESVMFAAAPILAFVLAWVLKISFDVARPVHPLIYAFGPSFPSGHAAVSTAYFLSILHFNRWTHNKWRRTVHYVFCIVCPLFVGISRLYFGVHWLSDVLVGYVVGAIAVYISIHYVIKIIVNEYDIIIY